MSRHAPVDGALLRDVIQWDLRTWRRALPVWQAAIDAGSPARVLAIGERQGGLSLWLARQGIEVICSDRFAFRPETQDLHQRHQVADRITYAREDVTNLSLADASVDMVIFKSVLGALGSRSRQAAAMAEMHRVLRPGGRLLFAENLTGTVFHAWLRRRFVPWAPSWRYLRHPKDLELFGSFPRVHWHTTGLLAVLGRTERQRSLLASADAVLCAITPASWHYVIYGVCTKDSARTPAPRGGPPV